MGRIGCQNGAISAFLPLHSVPEALLFDVEGEGLLWEEAGGQLMRVMDGCMRSFHLIEQAWAPLFAFLCGSVSFCS